MPACGSGAWWNVLKELDASTVVHVDLTPHAAREASAFSTLDAVERERWHRFPFSGPRRRFALCRSALRHMLCGVLGCANQSLSFGESCRGKPFAMVDNARVEISFNVSHSGRHGLIGFAHNGRLGVDVEDLVPRDDDYILSIAEQAFTQSERYALASARGWYKTELFFRLWTIKESLVKAVGMGLWLNMSGFEVPLELYEGTAATARHPQEPEVEWRIEYLGNRDFAGAIAHEVPALLR